MKLPSVYANKIDKNIRNNDEVFRNDSNVKRRDVRELIRFFDRSGYAEKLNVKLVYKDNSSSVERLVLYKNNYFINLDNKKISLSDVIDFEIQ